MQSTMFLTKLQTARLTCTNPLGLSGIDLMEKLATRMVEFETNGLPCDREVVESQTKEMKEFVYLQREIKHCLATATDELRQSSRFSYVWGSFQLTLEEV